MRTWWENEDILRQFRDWLTDTEREVAARREADKLAQYDDAYQDDDAYYDDDAEDAEAEDEEAEDDRKPDENAFDEPNAFENSREFEDRDEFEEQSGDGEPDDDWDERDHSQPQRQSTPWNVGLWAAPDRGRDANEDSVRRDSASQDSASQDSASGAQARADRKRAEAPLEPLPDVGLLSLVEAFTALRHELKLQTKSARGLESQLHEALGGLETARRHLESVRSREDESALRVARPLIESLAAVDEALRRGAQAVRATHDQIRGRSPDRLAEKLDERFHQLPAWRRWLARGWQQQVRQACTEMFIEADADAFHRLMEGYTLIVNRMARILQEHEVRRIACVGRRVDPARMTVVELTQDTSVEPETVVAEVRPGYEWQGKVIRFAEVRAASGRPNP